MHGIDETAITAAWPQHDIVEDLARMRGSSPLTHCITNIVVTNFTANVLLAIGAAPAMIVTIEEAAEFVRIAQALLINVGTITSHDAGVMLKAAATAKETRTPWVLDPVAAGVLAFRTGVVTELIRHKPAIIRGNASEILSVAGAVGGGKGVDSTAASGEAVPVARELAKETGAVVAISGEVDYLTDGETVIRVPGGDRIMTRVTGTGCALGALMAAFLPVTESPLKAATAASAIFAVAGERAARSSQGPGSFSVSFLDQLAQLGNEPGAGF
jgi:hydroxyethylthiazole kinase